MTNTELLFLGSSGCTPEAGNDTVCTLLNYRYLVDTGWASLITLRNSGIDPSIVDHVFFTHFHHDHYLSLPLYIYWHMRVNKPLAELHLIGPKEDLRRILGLTYSFLQETPQSIGWPSLHELLPGDRYENDELKVDCCRTLHQVPTLAYRFADKRTGKIITFSGDTTYSEEVVRLSKNCDILVHEASLGPRSSVSRKSLHSTAEDAGRAAADAGAAKLVLVHLGSDIAAESIKSAKLYFNGDVIWPKPHQLISLEQ